ncbi:PIN domain-containing protein [Pyrinomonas methylaliphatogenes]|nr:type II toxin-antitoxin system VapC family toxin [Pyrinomonas methylaliphatogenes]
MAVLAKARSMIEVTDGDKERAAEFVRYGIKPLDALHLALGES